MAAETGKSEMIRRDADELQSRVSGELVIVRLLLRRCRPEGLEFEMRIGGRRISQTCLDESHLAQQRLRCQDRVAILEVFSLYLPTPHVALDFLDSVLPRRG